MKTMLVRIFTRFQTIEDITTHGSSHMAKIQFKRLPACNKGESTDSGAPKPPKTALIASEDASQCKSTSQGACRCSARLDSLPLSSELRRPLMTWTKIGDTNHESETEADGKIQSRRDSATGKLSVSPGQLQAGADMPLKHPYSQSTFHKGLSAERYLTGDNAPHIHQDNQIEQQPLATI